MCSELAIPGIRPAKTVRMFRSHAGLEVRQPLEKFFAAFRAKDFAAVSFLDGHAVIIHP